MCTTDYLRRLTELSDGLMKLYIQKLAIVGNFKDNSMKDGDTESNDIAFGGVVVCSQYIRLLIEELFRKLLMIASEQKWDDYSELLQLFRKAVVDYPGLKPSKMDSETKEMYKKVITTLDESEEEIAKDDKNVLITCKNLLYKAD